MRFLLLLALAGCGPIELGGQPAEQPTEDAGRDPADGQQSAPAVRVILRVSPAGCEGCFELQATGQGGEGPYQYLWEDGSSQPQRSVCPDEGIDEVSVTAVDIEGTRSEPQTTRLGFADASCPDPPPLLCLDNPSFEGTPGYNDGNPASFDAMPWSQCTHTSMLNSPDVVNETLEQPVAEPPEPVDGETYLGLQEGEQISQALCEPIAAGEKRFVQLDARRLYIGAGIAPDSELPFLELWGGVAADCSPRALLWASQPLGSQWQTYCVTLAPQGYTDQLTLRARADGSLPTVTYLLVDNLVPVSSCP